MMSVPQSSVRLLATAIAGVIVCACGGSGVGAGPANPAQVTVRVTAGPNSPGVSISPGNGTESVRIDTPVTVHSRGGIIERVVVHTATDATPLEGKFSDQARAWTMTTPLDPNTTYVIAATAKGEGGTTTIGNANFTTMPVPERLITSPFPGDGSTVGVGMPIILKFNSAVDADKRANLVSHIDVKATPPTEGAWRWFADNEVHWRPKDYWAAGTKVSVDAHLHSVQANPTTWGLGEWSESFTIGERHVSIIDVASHQMQVFLGDHMIHDYPVSAGRPDHPTLGGTLFVWYKLQHVTMDSLSINIPRDAPDGYYGVVDWDTAISTNGFYIHSAPWSVWAQGHQNVSHGCVNVAPQNAEEFWNFSRIGDVVQVVNSPRPADFEDGEGDWQIAFDQYANSGAPLTVASEPRQGGGA
jgi:lipoprotein-anchoring transpeptidase ErfK/SrfK